MDDLTQWNQDIMAYENRIAELKAEVERLRQGLNSAAWRLETIADNAGKENGAFLESFHFVRDYARAGSIVARAALRGEEADDA